MAESVDALELIALARTSLRDTVLPETSGEQRHTVLMIANALAIALRQLEAGNEQDRFQRHAVDMLLSELALSVSPLSVSPGDSVEPERVLCAAIRQGRADPGEPMHTKVREYLEAITEQRLRRSNPRYLTSAEQDNSAAGMLQGDVPVPGLIAEAVVVSKDEEQSKSAQ